MTENESKEWEIKDPNAPDNTPQEKQPEVNNEPPKSVQDSIANAVQQYSSFQDQINNTAFNKKKTKEPKQGRTKKRGFFSGFIVSVITLVFLFVLLCIAITYMVQPEVDAEAEDIVNTIEKLETAYYTTFTKYFTAFEVVPKKSDDKETEKCEINLYGAKGIFSIAFCYLKSFISEYIPLE